MARLFRIHNLIISINTDTVDDIIEYNAYPIPKDESELEPISVVVIENNENSKYEKEQFLQDIELYLRKENYSKSELLDIKNQIIVKVFDDLLTDWM